LVTKPPRRFRSTRGANSSPYPKVPLAAMMGLARRRAATCTLRSTRSEGLTPREDTLNGSRLVPAHLLLLGRLLESFCQNSPVPGRERHPGQGRQGGRNVRRSCRLKIFSRLNPKPHEEHRHVLVVVVRCPMAGTCGPF